MSFLKTNYRDLSNNDFEPLPQGDYEVIIEQATENVTNSGAQSVQMKLHVRKDLDNVSELSDTNRKYHNRVVWINNWKRKATGRYNDQQFQYILSALKVPENKEFNTVDQYCQFIENKPIRAYIKITKDSYEGKDQERNDVAPWGFSETKFPLNKAASDATPVDPFKDNSGAPIDISDDDLPF